MIREPMRDEAGFPLWCQTRTSDRLHVVHVAERQSDDWWTDGEGTTLCGVSSYLNYPGIFSRMGCYRCWRCCRALGIPPGKGHPKNDDECRRLLGYGPRMTRAEIAAVVDADVAERAGEQP